MALSVTECEEEEELQQLMFFFKHPISPTSAHGFLGCKHKSRRKPYNIGDSFEKCETRAQKNCETIIDIRDEILLNFGDRRGAKGCNYDRSHHAHSNEYLVAK